MIIYSFYSYVSQPRGWLLVNGFFVFVCQLCFLFLLGHDNYQLALTSSFISFIDD